MRGPVMYSRKEPMRLGRKGKARSQGREEFRLLDFSLFVVYVVNLSNEASPEDRESSGLSVIFGSRRTEYTTFVCIFRAEAY